MPPSFAQMGRPIKPKFIIILIPDGPNIVALIPESDYGA